MALDSDIRDQAYQFFIQEAPELLQAIESGLLTLAQDRSTAKVHNIMRAAHSIKGAAASVGLEAIQTLAHRLEDMFKGLYSEELEINADLEGLLLQGYDCLRMPLTEQIETGTFNAEQALTTAEPIFAQIEASLGDFLNHAEHLPSSVELGVDIAQSIFEVDVAEGLDHLAAIVAHPEGHEVAGELRAQADTFVGLAELLNLPGFGVIAQTAIAALDAHPDQALQVTQIALADFRAGQQAVIAGDRTYGGAPSAALLELAEATSVARTSEVPITPVSEEIAEMQAISLEHVFSSLEEIRAEVQAGTLSPPEAPEVIPPEAVPLELQLSELGSAGDLSPPDDVFSLETPAVEQPELSREEMPEDTFTEEIATEETPLDPAIAKSRNPKMEALLDSEVIERPASTDAMAGFDLNPADAEALTPAPSLDDLFSSFVPDTDVPASAQASPPSSPPGAPASTSFLEVASTPTAFEPATNTAPSETPAPRQNADQPPEAAAPSLEDVFGVASPQAVPPSPEPPAATQKPAPAVAPAEATIADAVRSVQQAFESLPLVQDAFVAPTAADPAVGPTAPAATAAARLSVRVDLERLERMNNQVGELSINRNSLALQNEQLQASVQELLGRFSKFQHMAIHLRNLSDQMLVSPERFGHASRKSKGQAIQSHATEVPVATYSQGDFDALEMDSYDELHLLLQATLEQMVQLEEKIEDIVVFSGQSSQTVEQQRQMLTYLRDDLMWARMLPLGEVLNRFPRMIRDLSANYHKPVNLKLNGTGVLVDKAALEKLYDPLLHLLRNAFDHGIEPAALRRQQGKLEQGEIEIRAYHQGSQTIIEVRDDGGGLNLDRIRSRGLEMGLLSAEQATSPTSRLWELLFEPGFSTASQVSELSGRGVGLDVVRSQVRSLKGDVTVTSEPGQGSVFTLRIPLTLTITKLLVCLVGSTAFAFPSNSMEEILIPQAEQLQQSGGQQFLYWREQLVPTYQLSQLVNYSCPLPETLPSQVWSAVPTPEEWAAPMLLLRQGEQFLALEVERLLTEQELVIKPFGAAIAPPSYIYGCTILGDGSLVPVIDTTSLLNRIMGRTSSTAFTFSELPAVPTEDVENSQPAVKTSHLPTLLIVDDSIALRQTMALTLQKAGYRVLQARDGREAVEQLQQNPTIQMVICDIEMPNMNGFEFLSHRRQNPQMAQVPVAMLTSRSGDKHRRLATHLGANAYFTKPYIEQELLAAIQTVIAQSGSAAPALHPSPLYQRDKQP